MKLSQTVLMVRALWTRGDHPQGFERILHGQGVDHRGQHAHVVDRRLLDRRVLGDGAAANDVPAAHHQAQLDLQVDDELDLFRQSMEGHAVNAARAPGRHRPSPLTFSSTRWYAGRAMPTVPPLTAP